MNKLILIDGNGIMHRAYHAYPLLTSSDNTPTNVLYGFLSMIYKAVTDFHPNYIAVVFDTPKPTFRNEIYKNYQIQRPKIDNQFIIQIPLVKESLDKAKIFRIEKEGYEADDVIGTICELVKDKNDLQTIIISGDKDIFQLVNEKVFVASPVMGLSKLKIYDKEEVKKKLNVYPEEIVDYKALAGDSSDNYPGAKGIGPVTASSLIKEFKSIENLYENLDKIKLEKLKKILISEKENVYLSKKLASIVKKVPLEINIDKMKFYNFDDDLKVLLKKYQINSLIKRIFESENNQEEIKKNKEKKEQDQMGLF